MGVHTGDSITVAPALTLTDKEYQIMRDASIAVLREIGVETGGSNVQFAVNPADGRLVVIEMNPRVSRSSALASKATGFPIAKVAAKLAVGYTLDEIANDITGGATPASFEPTIDYVVTKIPRFAFEKFPGADAGADHLDEIGRRSDGDRPHLPGNRCRRRCARWRPASPASTRSRSRASARATTRTRSAPRSARRRRTGCCKVAQAMRLGVTDERDPRRLQDRSVVPRRRSAASSRPKRRSSAKGLPTTPGAFRRLKAMGFSDARLGKLTGVAADEVTQARRALGVRPVFKRIDTCAAEFASPTAYMYSTYEPPFAGAARQRGRAVRQEEGRHPRRRAEPHRPGHRVRLLLLPRLLRAEGRRLRNHHDQLQSGDGVDRLRHLRPALFRAAHRRRRARDHRHRAQNGTLHGVIVQFGGQTPLKLAEPLEQANVPILGTSPDAIDLAEDRDRFKQLLDKLKLRQPQNGIATQPEAGARDRRGDRLSDRDPAVLRAGRPRHGDRPRRARSSTAIWCGCRRPRPAVGARGLGRSGRC